jgi:two-component system cell cycle sensor histidine kinase/response regulator CckA
MDDGQSIRQLGALALQRMGLEATVVADGASAVDEFAKAKAAGRPYHLVILDLSVEGGLGGVETIKQLRKIDPDILAIVSNGYSDDPVLANFRTYGFRAMVPKPYNIEQFTQTVERLLG